MTRMETTGERILNVLGYPDAVACVGFVDDAQICKLHAKWFGDPSPTNVVSLEYHNDGTPSGLIGEVYVSVDAARREAGSAGLSLAYRAAWLMMHGLLHICGYEHVNVDEEVMRRMEEMEVKLDREILIPIWNTQ